VTARVLLLVPIAATTVLFPRIATLRDARRERRYLLLGLSVVAAVSAVCVALLWVFSVTVIDVGFGSKYEDGAAWLGPLSLAMALYGLAIVYLYHFLALGRARFGAVLVLLLGAQIVAYGLFHNAPSDLVGIQIAFGATAAVAGELWYRLRIR
jgi:O-antigen/teichoic acid export membrane protein